MFCFPQFSVSRTIPAHSGYLLLKVATAVIAIGQICLWSTKARPSWDGLEIGVIPYVLEYGVWEQKDGGQA